jgi:leucyl aminopeptidase
MKPDIRKISQLAPEQSVVCLLGSDKIPGFLKLGKLENEYAVKQLANKEDSVFINSYHKCTYLIRIKSEGSPERIREELRKTAAGLRKLIKSNDHKELVITSHEAYGEAIGDFIEGFVLSIYRFDRYKTKDEDAFKKRYPDSLLVYGEADRKQLDWLSYLLDAVYFARDLINEPVNHLNATALGEALKQKGLEAGIKVEVFNKKKIEALKMGGLLAVNKGSIDPPAFCILEWRPANAVNKKPVVLVGKGIVYDTGGLNIKTGDYMNQMKGDMAGAATVAGAICTIAKYRLPLYVVALVPSTDNRPGGNAYAAGDIIRMHNGMTVEVGNTDAEGRIILGDALSYAARYKPELIINVATLTGSAAVTFSNQAIAMMTNAPRKYVDLLVECGHEVHERVAELPFWEEYGDMIKSDVADVKNIGPREAGAITAGKFLEKFTEYPLIHLDIAGTGLLRKDDHYRIKEGPGSGLRLLAAYLKKFSSEYKKLK